MRIDRIDTLHCIGGGLLIYVKNGLVIKSVDKICSFNQYAQFELLSKDSRKNNLQITLVYRPPSASEENTHELCKLIEGAGPNSLFIGDFNFPAIDWLMKHMIETVVFFLKQQRKILCNW